MRRLPLSTLALAIAVAAGTLADRPWNNPPLTLGGYRVLAVDFHTHSSMWSDGALTPWGLVLEAERQGLDALAITGHNETWDAHLGRRFSRAIGGPLVLVGEEIVRPSTHVIAAGISTTVGFLQSAVGAIDEVHRQGGVAIAAHPDRDFWAGYDQRAMASLDGSEICHPSVFAPEFLRRENIQQELEQFASRAPLAAIGSSDFHGLGLMGICRTFVFVDDASEQGILDAVRARRTVVFGRDGRGYGHPALIRLAADAGNFRDREPARRPAGWLDWISRVGGVLGLWGAVVRRNALRARRGA